jgi:hypothetical protein
LRVSQTNLSSKRDSFITFIPALKGKFILMLRLYWPNETDPSIKRDVENPPVEKV